MCAMTVSGPPPQLGMCLVSPGAGQGLGSPVWLSLWPWSLDPVLRIQVGISLGTSPLISPRCARLCVCPSSSGHAFGLH